ncbi:MAG: MlaD family protein [Spirochaetaceae bacterium]|jgi:phospholipid/cholesterol/gamma-HCH transport system substrate-binding protein|nr:MlaD family protein [Spirochaetaceae bacterium]
MKFRIRFADQIVGLFLILALASLAFVIVMLGGKQRWFARDYLYKTYLESATGISENMALQYKGFTIGNVKSIDLSDDDRVEVVFSVHDRYQSRVREGSLVELQVNPLGLGNHFVFYPGLGLGEVEEGAWIPSVSSPEGRAYINDGLAYVPAQADNITLIIGRVNTALDSVNRVALQIQEAFAGTGETALGRTVRSADQTLEAAAANLDPLLRDIRRITENLEQVSAVLASPDNALMNTLDVEGPVYTSLAASLRSVSGTLGHLDKASSYLPSQMPQITVLIAEVREAVKTAEDVLVAMSNSPLLRRGIPDQVETRSSGTSPRDIQF